MTRERLSSLLVISIFFFCCTTALLQEEDHDEIIQLMERRRSLHLTRPLAEELGIQQVGNSKNIHFLKRGEQHYEHTQNFDGYGGYVETSSVTKYNTFLPDFHGSIEDVLLLHNGIAIRGLIDHFEEYLEEGAVINSILYAQNSEEQENTRHTVFRIISGVSRLARDLVLVHTSPEPLNFADVFSFTCNFRQRVSPSTAQPFLSDSQWRQQHHLIQLNAAEQLSPAIVGNINKDPNSDAPNTTTTILPGGATGTLQVGTYTQGTFTLSASYSEGFEKKEYFEMGVTITDSRLGLSFLYENPTAPLPTTSFDQEVFEIPLRSTTLGPLAVLMQGKIALKIIGSISSPSFNEFNVSKKFDLSISGEARYVAGTPFFRKDSFSLDNIKDSNLLVNNDPGNLAFHIEVGPKLTLTLGTTAQSTIYVSSFLTDQFSETNRCLGALDRNHSMLFGLNLASTYRNESTNNQPGTGITKNLVTKQLVAPSFGGCLDKFTPPPGEFLDILDAVPFQTNTSIEGTNFRAYCFVKSGANFPDCDDDCSISLGFRFCSTNNPGFCRTPLVLTEEQPGPNPEFNQLIHNTVDIAPVYYELSVFIDEEPSLFYVNVTNCGDKCNVNLNNTNGGGSLSVTISREGLVALYFSTTVRSVQNSEMIPNALSIPISSLQSAFPKSLLIELHSLNDDTPITKQDVVFKVSRDGDPINTPTKLNPTTGVLTATFDIASLTRNENVTNIYLFVSTTNNFVIFPYLAMATQQYGVAFQVGSLPEDSVVSVPFQGSGLLQSNIVFQCQSEQGDIDVYVKINDLYLVYDEFGVREVGEFGNDTQVGNLPKDVPINIKFYIDSATINTACRFSVQSKIELGTEERVSLRSEIYQYFFFDFSYAVSVLIVTTENSNSRLLLSVIDIAVTDLPTLEAKNANFNGTTGVQIPTFAYPSLGNTAYITFVEGVLPTRIEMSSFIYLLNQVPVNYYIGGGDIEKQLFYYDITDAFHASNSTIRVRVYSNQAASGITLSYITDYIDPFSVKDAAKEIYEGYESFNLELSSELAEETEDSQIYFLLKTNNITSSQYFYTIFLEQYTFITYDTLPVPPVRGNITSYFAFDLANIYEFKNEEFDLGVDVLLRSEDGDCDVKVVNQFTFKSYSSTKIGLLPERLGMFVNVDDSVSIYVFGTCNYTLTIRSLPPFSGNLTSSSASVQHIRNGSFKLRIILIEPYAFYSEFLLSDKNHVFELLNYITASNSQSAWSELITLYESSFSFATSVNYEDNYFEFSFPADPEFPQNIDFCLYLNLPDIDPPPFFIPDVNTASFGGVVIDGDGNPNNSNCVAPVSPVPSISPAPPPTRTRTPSPTNDLYLVLITQSPSFSPAPTSTHTPSRTHLLNTSEVETFSEITSSAGIIVITLVLFVFVILI